MLKSIISDKHKKLFGPWPSPTHASAGPVSSKGPVAVVGVAGPVAVAGGIAPVVPQLPEEILYVPDSGIRIWTWTALSSPLWLNFHFILVVVGVLLGAVQVGQQDGGDIQWVEFSQFI